MSSPIRAFIAFILLQAIFIILPVTSSADTLPGEQPWIRVALSVGQQTVTITASGGSRITYAASSQVIGEYNQSHTYTFSYSNGRVIFGSTGDTQSTGFSITCTGESGRLQHSGKSYRRVIQVVPWDGGIACINVLPIEEYLWGVVPCEVPQSWPEETLRAQAVAARTYSYRAIGQYPERPFDVYSSVVDQLYQGAGSERESTTRACQDTAGEICTWNGEPIIAYFHSCAGGWTASGEEMFGRALPYLRPVPSRDYAVHRWVYTISTGSLESALRSAGHIIGRIQRIWVHRFSGEGRADEVKIVHSSGVLLISGSDMRKALGPSNIESTYFTIEGQPEPDIPDGSTMTSSIGPVVSLNPMEEYALAHPGVLVPVAVARNMETCVVASSGGLFEASTLRVLGAENTREYLDGYIWVADAVRAGELGDENTGSIVDSIDFESPILPSPPVVDDPGGNVGYPTNGSVVFVGHGCGHGVGMSQHGARILAESGWTYRQILTYFYSGVEIETEW